MINSCVSPNFSSGWLRRSLIRRICIRSAAVAPHHERIGVVEAEFARHADAEFRELFRIASAEMRVGDAFRISSPIVPVYSG